MKKITVILSLLALVMISCQDQAPSNKYTINGTIVGAKSDKVYLNTLNDDRELIVIDSAQISEGKFTFEDTCSTLELVYLTTSQKGRPFVSLFLPPGVITVTADLSIPSNNTSIQGGEANNLLSAVNDKYQSFVVERNKLANEYRTAQQDKDESRMEEIVDEIEGKADALGAYLADSLKLLYNDNPATPHIILSYGENMGLEYEDFKGVYDLLSDNVKNSKYGLKLNEKLEKLAKVQVGAVAPDFTLNTPDGEPIKLSSLRGKYILLDFWASWCGPCRAENPNVVKAYNKYKGKKFDILGVSLDNDKEKWLKAIEDDKLTWHHVSDLKGWENEASQMYSVRGIPTNFLLDSEGKIVATNLRGEDLEKKLAELLP
ncbi:MAG: redoxin family protein [Bacteroidales bacterium]